VSLPSDEEGKVVRWPGQVMPSPDMNQGFNVAMAYLATTVVMVSSSLLIAAKKVLSPY
jgi:hypothetical protein